MYFNIGVFENCTLIFGSLCKKKGTQLACFSRCLIEFKIHLNRKYNKYSYSGFFFSKGVPNLVDKLAQCIHLVVLNQICKYQKGKIYMENASLKNLVGRGQFSNICSKLISKLF